MPTLLEELDIKLDFGDLAKRIPLVRVVNDKRPAGVHQSSIITHVARSIPSIAKTLVDGKDEDEYPLIWALGQAWEEFVFSLYPEIEYQPGSQEKNGIWRSIDGRSLIDFKPKVGQRRLNLNMVEEGKFTYKSLREGEAFLREWMYMEQGKGYASVCGVRHVRWHVMFVKGDYKNFGPIYRRYLVEFSQKEIDATEKMLVVNKGKVKPETGGR